MRTEDILVNAIERFSIGVDRDSGRYYLSIPVSNRLVDYEEHYELTELEYQNLMSDTALATHFAADCRAHQLDARLMVRPARTGACNGHQQLLSVRRAMSALGRLQPLSDRLLSAKTEVRQVGGTQQRCFFY